MTTKQNTTKKKEKRVKIWIGCDVEGTPLVVTLEKPEKYLLDIDKHIRRLGGKGFYHEVTISLPITPKKYK